MSTGFNTMLEMLRACGEATRLRLLALLSRGELSVGEMVQALGQSQPRLSHHLKILASAGIVERLPEGAWVFYRWAQSGSARQLLDQIFEDIDPDSPVLQKDRAQLNAIRAKRQDAASAHFDELAADWDRVRALHTPNEAIESELLSLVEGQQFSNMLDIGTGTGRLLNLFASQVAQADGLDFSHDMLTVARAMIAQEGHEHIHLRHGMAEELPYPDSSKDFVTIHQVLHFLLDPERAIEEIARVLRPGGTVLIVDFAPHGLEFLRDEYGHERLGIAAERLQDWGATKGLDLAEPKTLASPTEQGLTVMICRGRKRILLKESAA